jgi:hypothetical protein
MNRYVSRTGKIMAFPEIALKRIDKLVGGLCRKKTHDQYKDELIFEYRLVNHDVLILEIRPMWNNPKEKTETSVAKLKFNRTKNLWQLYWQRASGKWLKYEENSENKDLSILVTEIEKDSFGCFFG